MMSFKKSAAIALALLVVAANVNAAAAVAGVDEANPDPSAAAAPLASGNAGLAAAFGAAILAANAAGSDSSLSPLPQSPRPATPAAVGGAGVGARSPIGASGPLDLQNPGAWDPAVASNAAAATAALTSSVSRRPAPSVVNPALGSAIAYAAPSAAAAARPVTPVSPVALGGAGGPAALPAPSGAMAAIVGSRVPIDLRSGNLSSGFARVLSAHPEALVIGRSGNMAVARSATPVSPVALGGAGRPVALPEPSVEERREVLRDFEAVITAAREAGNAAVHVAMTNGADTIPARIQTEVDYLRRAGLTNAQIRAALWSRRFSDQVDRFIANPAAADRAAAAAAAPAPAPAGDPAAAAAAAAANPVPANPAADKRTRAQKAGDALVAGFCAAIAGVKNHKVTTGASVATLVSLTATGARLKVMFNAATPAVKAAGFKAFYKAELKKVFARDPKADKYVTAGVIATVASFVTTVGSLALHETGYASTWFGGAKAEQLVGEERNIPSILPAPGRGGAAALRTLSR